MEVGESRFLLPFVINTLQGTPPHVFKSVNLVAFSVKMREEEVKRLKAERISRFCFSLKPGVTTHSSVARGENTTHGGCFG